ncbi:hypothetical protein [Gelidibacter pelagius]|uniref:Uncharacterized protein n=1 Tax=Gelidibacter pelagius TaxID=2819985 RepID=A0ABS3SPV4_9FLAO|nr:hypothetical protein [Gelidibacter pelagius]MBO3096967.1 hypothetical protein [Gelidibacter pelagius]
MKNLLLFLVLLIGISIANAQEFQKTDAYQVSIHPIVNDKEHTLFNVSVVLTDRPETVVTNFKVMSPESIKKISIQSLKQPNLLDVEEIIKMELTYFEPQACTISKYVLVKENGAYIDLPAIVNMKDNYPKMETTYVFPNQALGQINKIITLEITYSDAFSIENIEVIKAFAWQDNFDTSHQVSALY